MKQFDNLNNSMKTESISQNDKSVFQAKNKSIILLVLFVLYVISVIFFRIIYDRNLLEISVKTFDISVVIIAILVYFCVAKKKLPDGRKVKKYDDQTREIARIIIIVIISFFVLLTLLFLFGFGTY
ncbi:hypothetical protein LJB92_00280 [Bacteroidales bacterium OttesenSCG-928-M06]|nr:hypothetical protein [Bacteroidales bacterium OttesenSCG-928-M06]